MLTNLTETEYQQSMYKILGILTLIAPNSEAQMRCAKLYHEIINGEGYSRRGLQCMTSALYDGVKQ